MARVPTTDPYPPRLSLIWRVAIAWAAFVVALAAGGIAGELAPLPRWAALTVTAVVTGGIATGATLLLRRHVDRRSSRELGLPPRRTGRHLLAGFAFATAVQAALVVVGVHQGWVGFDGVELSRALALAVGFNVAVAFLLEALPEELVFRGYLFTNLNARFRRWTALVLQVLLFVSTPFAANLVSAPLRDALQLEPAGAPTSGWYAAVLVVFGAVLQLCRLVTGSLWFSMGFHLGYLQLARYGVGVPEQPAYDADVPPAVRLDYSSPWAPLVFPGFLLVTLVLLVVGPALVRRRIGWRDRAP